MPVSKPVVGAVVLVLATAGAALWHLQQQGLPSGDAAGTAPGAAGGAAPDAAASPAAARPSFRDARAIPTGGDAAPDAAAPRQPEAGGVFTDARPLTVPSFRDARALTTPSFRDERAVVAPSFRDERTVAAPSFRDERTVAAPSFRDERALDTPQFRDNRAILPASEDGGRTEVASAAVPAVPQRPVCVPPEIKTEARPAGMMRLEVTANCLANQPVRIGYGGAEIYRNLDAGGRLDMLFDCFAGTEQAAELHFTDGTRREVPIATQDLDRVSKIAVIWRAPVNLDLHVFEYAARFSQPGHVWAKANPSLPAVLERIATEQRGHGLLSTVDGAETFGDKVEIYTLLHDDRQASGTIGLALDYETRGEVPSGAACGNGSFAEVDFQVVLLPRAGKAARQSGVLTRAECGKRLAEEVRFNQSALPGLRIRR